jgi:hypothetical protein
MQKKIRIILDAVKLFLEFIFLKRTRIFRLCRHRDSNPGLPVKQTRLP